MEKRSASENFSSLRVNLDDSRKESQQILQRLIIIRKKEKERELIYLVQIGQEYVMRLHDENQTFRDWMGRVHVYERQKVPPLYPYLPSVPPLARRNVQALIEITQLIHVPLQ